MSCLPVQSASLTYAATLIHAQKIYDESASLLLHALGSKTVEGSIAYQVDQLDRETQQMNSTSEQCENFASLRNQFVLFTAAQLSKFETTQKAHVEGLKAIEVIRGAQQRCTAFKLNPEQETLLRFHMRGLGVNVAQYEEKQAETRVKIAQYPFDTQIAELEDKVTKVAEQIILIETALDRAFLAKKTAEGNVGFMDMLPSYNNSYLQEAIAAKAAAKTPGAAKQVEQKNN